MYDTSEESNMDILHPKALILNREADCTDAAFFNGEQGSLAYDNNAVKLGFVTSAGVSEETVTSA
jgi:hypothetical protein